MPTAAGPMVIAGGGPGTVEARQALLTWATAGIGGPPRVVVLFITYDDERGNATRLNAELRRWIDDGAAEAVDAGVYDRTDAFRPEVGAAIRSADIVFIPGGDATLAYDTLWGTPALDAIREASDAGAVLAGLSAGAMIWGVGDIHRGVQITGDYAYAEGAPAALLGWLPAVVLPHYSAVRDDLREMLAAWPGVDAIAISNGAAVLIHPGWRCVSLLCASPQGEGAFVLSTPDGELVPLRRETATELTSSTGSAWM